uniref:Bacterial surface antigen (D15) domain-containing protein n=1 Tax=Aplanochytrium stocchinoi TaxID=215587 RepID=A0A7S3PJC9_9STRA
MGDRELLEKPLQVRYVKILGNKRTNPSVIEQHLQEAYAGTTVNEVSLGLMKGLNKLKKLEIFDAVEITCEDVDTNNNKTTNINDTMVNDNEYFLTDVVVNVREKGILNMKAETFIEGGGSEGGVESTLGLRNPLGSGEQIRAGISYGSKSSNSYTLSLSKPYVYTPIMPLNLNICVDEQTHNRVAFSSYDELLKNALISFSDESGRHSFGYISSWRDIIPVKNKGNPYLYDCSSAIMQQASPSFKSSINYSYTSDSRDDMMGPRSGRLFKFRTELAGLALGGDVSFSKTEFTYQAVNPLFPNWPIILGLTFKGGLLCPLNIGLFNSDSKANHSTITDCSSHISDRFFLGGALTMRGFEYKGVGPRSHESDVGASSSGGDSLGGDMTWQFGANLAFPLPSGLLNAAGIKGQLFLNAGNLTEWGASMRTVCRGARVSVGTGLILPTPIGRLEATWSWILRANNSDQKKRFQLGVGMDFI